jgi:hypothetical protein
LKQAEKGMKCAKTFIAGNIFQALWPFHVESHYGNEAASNYLHFTVKKNFQGLSRCFPPK